ncbi:MAG: sterol desaturase family protein [Planctomycetota bacterium]|nr:MAG: sterol desaturase family protein [Planctomycetota bacterium]
MDDCVLLYAVPAFLLLLAVEVWYDRRLGTLHYEPKDTAASLGLGVGSLVAMSLSKLASLPLYLWVYEHRLFEVPLAWWSLALLILADDHAYYWYHRAMHEVPVLWAAHVPHHSSQRFHLATALRQPWLTGWFHWLFWLPLPWLGFHPAWVYFAQAVNLIYQFWIHTPFIRKLGPIEWVFNTPSHHRVHHGSNPQYLDRNHGGILIVWDRMFGTFTPETETVCYGITKPVHTHNPLRLVTDEYRDLFRTATHSRSLGDAVGVFLRPRRRKVSV